MSDYLEVNTNLINYIKYLIKHFNCWYRPHDNNNKYKVPQDPPNGYGHMSNKINTELLSNKNIKNLLKKSDTDICNIINSNVLLNAILNSSLSTDKLGIFIDALFETDIKYNNNIAYTSIFKALSTIKDSKKIFLRHELEKKDPDYFNIDAKSLYPPKDSYFSNNNAWPIEFGVISEKTEYNSNIIWSAEKSSKSNLILPILDKDIFDKYNGTIFIGYDKNERDHLYAFADIPLDNWIILLTLGKSDNIDKLLIKNIDHLLNISPIVDIEIISLYNTLKDLLVSRLLILKRVSTTKTNTLEESLELKSTQHDASNINWFEN